LTGNEKERLLPQFTFYIVVSPDDGRSCLPKHVVYVRINECLTIYGVVLIG